MADQLDFSASFRAAHPESESAKIVERIRDQLFDQTKLVEACIEAGLFEAHSPTYTTEDYQMALDHAQIPYLMTPYGVWIGSTRKSLDFVAEQITNAIFEASRSSADEVRGSGCRAGTIADQIDRRRIAPTPECCG